MPEVLEIMRFQVLPENAARFLEERGRVDAEVRQIAGFLGAELCEGAAGAWVLIVRWESPEATSAAQRITASLPAITAWVSISSRVESFQTVQVRRVA